MPTTPARVAPHGLRRTLATVWPLLVTIVCLLGLSWWSTGLNLAARAYIAGESLWSKAQKSAVIALLRYTRTGGDAEYASYLEAVAVMRADREARLALEQSPPDREAAHRDFLQGGNDPADVDYMIDLFIRFREVSFMRTAVAQWTQADALALELETVGETAHRLRQSSRPDLEELERLRAQTMSIDRALTPLARQFSALLSEASRTVGRLSLALMIATAIVLVGVGLLLIHRLLSTADETRAERDALHGDLQLAFDLTQAVNRASLLEEVYEPAIDALVRALDLDRASILLFDPDGVMRFKAWRGLSDTYRKAVEGHSPWTQAERNAVPILVEDTGTDPGSAAYRTIFLAEDIHAMAFIPLVYRGSLLGKFMVYSHHRRCFSPREVRLVQTVAAQVAASVSRARLFESERAYAKQTELLYAQEHRAVNMRDQFISIASHELNTPLTVLKLNVQLIDRYREQPQQFAGAIEKLQGNIARLERLIVQLLDVSRMSGSKLVLARSATHLGAIVQAVLQRAQPELDRSGSVLAPSIDEAVSGSWDADRLDQVATNLIQNAIKYGEGRPITVRVAAEGESAVLSVKDEGIGIAVEDQARIFERFERAVSPQHFGGFGLGLWIVRAVVEAHGGSITVVSSAGKGAEFRVSLPTTAAATVAAPVAQLLA